VKFPVEGLDMRPYVITLQNEPEPVLYDLIGVSNHYGSLNGGHYTAAVKNCVTGKWYNMNDSSCSESSGSPS
jgi:ubiquitin carboxyl-terminal hydrolase 4/11/15